MNSGLPEFFDSRFHAGAGGPNVVEKKIGGVGVDLDLWVEAIGGFGLGEASFAISANLNGVIGAEENFGYLIMAKLSEAFSNEISMVQAAGANMVTDSGQRHDNDRVAKCG